MKTASKQLFPVLLINTVPTLTHWHIVNARTRDNKLTSLPNYIAARWEDGTPTPHSTRNLCPLLLIRPIH